MDCRGHPLLFLLQGFGFFCFLFQFLLARLQFLALAGKRGLQARFHKFQIGRFRFN